MGTRALWVEVPMQSLCPSFPVQQWALGIEAGGGSPANLAPKPAKGLKPSIDGIGLCYSQGKAVLAE